MAIGFANYACVGDDPHNVPSPGNDSGLDDAGGGSGDSGDPSSCACDGAPCFEGVCGGAKIVQLAVGGTFACALRASGSVWCWGTNDYGELGDPDRKDAATCTSGARCYPSPAAVPGLRDVVQINAATWGICAVTKVGDVHCWGMNRTGELGVVDTSSKCGETPCLKKPTKVDKLPPASEVSLAKEFGCARTKAKEIYCWGRNDVGQLGTGSTNPDWQAPAKVDLPRLATSISVSGSNGFHACTIVDDGTVHCWGFNAHGQLGRTTTEPELCNNQGAQVGCSRSPIPFPGLSKVAELVAGDGHTCVRTEGGKVLCYGYRGYGIGNLDQARDLGISNPIHLASRNQHVCVATSSGQVLCLGTSTEARIGYVEREDAPPCVEGIETPPCRKDPYSVGVTASVVESFNVSLALRNDGRVVAWGPNAHGLLGHASGEGDVSCPNPGKGTSVPCSPTPQLVPNLP